MAASPIAGVTSPTNWQHFGDQLALLNAYLLQEVQLRTANQQQRQLDQLQGLVLSEHEIVSFLTRESTRAPIAADCPSLREHLPEIENRISQRQNDGDLRSTVSLNQLTALFQLARIEEQCIVLCLAPEIDPNYSKVFAFLQDDVTRKQPSIDLALRLFSNDQPDQIKNRSIFSPASRLMKNRLLQFSEPAGRNLSFSQATLKLDDRIAAFLLETPQLDEFLLDWVEFVAPQAEVLTSWTSNEVRDQTLRLVEQCFARGEAPQRPLIHLYGKPGSGRRELAILASQRIGLPLLVADVRSIPPGIDGVEALWRLGRESVLLPGVILVEGFDELLTDGKRRELNVFLSAVANFSPLTFLSGTQQWNTDKPRQLFLSLECPVPNSTERLHYWRQHIYEGGHSLAVDDLVELSSKFNFTAGQISQTVEAARCRAYWENPSMPQLNANILSRAARSVATPNLGGLARKIERSQLWSDIVLPDAQLKQLLEIVAHVKRSQVVFEEWGFDRKFSYGRGVTALFEGPSGTGKTMAAGILSNTLGLELYKIDLSAVVSKYIGETEKNLNRIFAEAQDSNAILFFDEADALFGKRSEVKDAHDRYANLETAFLLQRMEEYSGVVILASNMKQNMDEAFVRRMRFIVHFPFPSDKDRELIWQKSFPEGAPLGADVDFRWLARKLEVTGGNIKNISLRAAFLAVDRQSSIDMTCLIEATTREIEKIGKILTMGEFRPPVLVVEPVEEVA